MKKRRGQSVAFMLALRRKHGLGEFKKKRKVSKARRIARRALAPFAKLPWL